MARLYTILSSCKKEEEVKAEFAKYFKFKINADKRYDHYSKQILYEFKLSKNFKNLKARATVIAQTIYYIRDIKYGKNAKPIPPYVCVVDKDEAFIFETKEYHKFYTNNKNKYDWDRTASLPCPKLVADIENFSTTKLIHVYELINHHEEEQFVITLKNYAATQIQFDLEKKVINENNFLETYSHWQSLFGQYVENGKKSSEYFISDIEKGRSNKIGESIVNFDLGNDISKNKNIPRKDYDYFWSIYEKVDDLNVIYSIRQKIDRISEDYQRRFTGEFYTPVEYAEKAWRYIEKSCGNNWWAKGNWRIWDMAAGPEISSFPCQVLHCSIAISLLY